MSEVFYTKDATRGSFIVTVLWTCMIDDIAVCEYNGKEYTLKWNPYRSMYEGRIDGYDGYII